MSYVFISTKKNEEDLDFAYLEADDDLRPIKQNKLSFSSDQDEIYDILTNPDNGIFGWTAYEDCTKILDAFSSKGIEPFDFQVFDVKYMLNVILADRDLYDLRKYIPLYLQKDKGDPQLENEPFLILLALKNLLFCLGNSIDVFLNRRDFDSCFYYSLDVFYAKAEKPTTPNEIRENYIANLEKIGVNHYVFFDFECANCYNGSGKICELGAIETDLDFNIIKEHHFPINPNAPFCLTDRDGVKRIHLYWEDNDYQAYKEAPKLEHFYDFFKELLEDEHSLKFGHAVENDLWFLASDLKRNSLEQLNVLAVDTQMMYRLLVDESSVSIALHKALVSLCGEEELEKYDHHNSLDDSKMTMRIAKEMLEKSGTNIIELIKSRPTLLKIVDDADLVDRLGNPYKFPVPDRFRKIELAVPERLYTGIYALNESDRLIKEAATYDYDKAHMGAFDGRKYIFSKKCIAMDKNEIQSILNKLKMERKIVTNDYSLANYLITPNGIQTIVEKHERIITKKRRRWY